MARAVGALLVGSGAKISAVAGRYEHSTHEAAEFIGVDRAPGNEPARRIQPQGFQQYLMGEGHGFGGAEVEQRLPGSRVRLGLQPLGGAEFVTQSNSRSLGGSEGLLSNLGAFKLLGQFRESHPNSARFIAVLVHES